MARNRQSPFEDLVDLISILPWWVGAALAPIAYLLLHAYAAKGITPTAGNPADMAVVVKHGLFHVFAVFGQLILPFAFVLGACISAYNQFVRRKLHNRVAASPVKDALQDMTWRQFEMLVGEAYRRQGYQVKDLGGTGPDGGADLIITKEGRKYLVQCKQWKAYKVGVKPVRELLGVMVGMGATGAIIVTSGEFTRDAVNFARNNNIQLVDGVTLHEMTKGIKNSEIQPSNMSVAPVCPRCGNSMVLRTARKGTNAGRQFWGCSGYPSCRSTMPLSESASI